MFKTVIWATDGSEAADRALPSAKALAQRGGRLLAVHAIEAFAGKVTGFPVPAGEEDLEAKIRTQVDDLRTEGYDATFKLVSGASAEIAYLIADVARATGAEVIVVGSRGHGRVASMIVGSVTQRLLSVAPCPVLVVPAAGNRRQRDRVPSAAAVENR